MAEKIIAETSARHVHLTEEHVEILFGKGHALTHKKDLSQPGQFACEERVNVDGPKSTLKNVIVLGPTRPATQVELSLTDARSIGIVSPIRESGDIAGSASVKLIGPEGEVVIEDEENPNAPMYRNGVGYKTELENGKIKRLVAHYYYTDC